MFKLLMRNFQVPQPHFELPCYVSKWEFSLVNYELNSLISPPPTRTRTQTKTSGKKNKEKKLPWFFYPIDISHLQLAGQTYITDLMKTCWMRYAVTMSRKRVNHYAEKLYIKIVKILYEE